MKAGSQPYTNYVAWSGAQASACFLKCPSKPHVQRGSPTTILLDAHDVFKEHSHVSPSFLLQKYYLPVFM